MERTESTLDPASLWAELLRGTCRVSRRVCDADRWFAMITRAEDDRDEERALTARQRRIVELVGLGMSHGEIGYELGIGLSTAATHLTIALSKLRLLRTDLPVIARGAGVLRTVGDGAGVMYCSPRAQASLGELTAAEQDVARLVFLGFTNAEIAASRRSSERTVANQLASIFRKLRVQARLDLVRVVGERARASEAPRGEARPIAAIVRVAS